MSTETKCNGNEKKKKKPLGQKQYKNLIIKSFSSLSKKVK